MNNAMIILDEKHQLQLDAAATLKDEFRKAIWNSMNVTSLKVDEVQYFGMKVFREILGELRREKEMNEAEMESREDAIKRWKSEWKDEQKALAPIQADPVDIVQ
jgi:hypothetical protein